MSASELQKAALKLASENPEFRKALTEEMMKGATSLPWDRFYKALDGIRAELRKAKSFNDMDLAAGHIPTYVRGGASKGFLPRTYTTKYNKMLRGMGVKGIGDDALENTRKAWLAIVDDMEKSARRLEKKAK